MSGATFLPDHLRPRPAVRRRRRGSRLALALPALLMLTPLWSLQAVQVDGGASLPACEAQSLAELVGSPLLVLDLDRVRQQVERWPSVAAVDLRVGLSGTLSVHVEPAVPVGSMVFGHGWHGISHEGRFTGALAAPVEPVLQGFRPVEAELGEGLRTAQRLARLTGGQTVRVRKLTPDDFEVELRSSGAADAAYVVHVTPAGRAAERRWGEMVQSGNAPGGWADLRWDDRMVVAAAPGGVE